MNTETYTYLLDNPQQIGDHHLRELEGVIQAYPYFQSARALQLKVLKNSESYRYNDALRKTAAYTSDRNILFEYITSEEFVQNEISNRIKEHDPSVKEIVVHSENISEQVSLEIDRQLKSELKKAEAILNPDLFERKLASVENLVEDPTAPEAEEIEAKPETSEAETEEIIPEAEEIITEVEEDVLEVDKPLEFNKEDSHSFSEWLKLTKAAPIERKYDTKNTKEDSKARKFELIDKFIQGSPKIDPTVTKGKNKNLAKPYTRASESLMTETLARVYVQQKNYKKAIQAYNILILKYPEKSGFFADQIRAIKKLINTEDS
ncbi:hypothetical protein J1N09_02685 [Aureitalea sp. L0-47]|uniref:hypothetical protein n=1 Tax=Aureitalea sp. L0-47 TaxID=2816962 RepID=UPI0022378905|nr:hypothetical protein [Aureitalea sp. L0-47]MCW5518729.1 hypothetical protein [Aureitalea sp. L0-47]